MPFGKLILKPGVDIERTRTLNDGSFSVSQLIRFFGGLVQKLGGWMHLQGISLIGVCRGLHGWAGFDGTPYLAVGTEQRLSIVIGGALSDITPIAHASALVNAFSTVLGGPDVTVQDAGYSPASGDWIYIVSTVSIGGLTLQGYYQVNTPVPPNLYTFNAGAVATSTVSNAGSSTVDYLLPSGYAVNTGLSGWGVGDWGLGNWGEGNSSGAAIGQLRQWSLDHFGQDLIANPSGGSIYYWAPPTPSAALVVSGSAPTKVLVAFVMGQAQIIIAAGAETGGTLFPTLIRWCDSGDFTDWTASATNQAGSFQLPTGSTVVAGLAMGLGALIWTDQGLWSMVYQGLPFVFGFNQVGVNCEAISMRAPVVVGTRVVWPSIRSWFVYDGSGVSPMECPVWDFFFNNLDTTQLGQVHGGRNTLFNEAAWWFPMTSGGIGRVKWNYLENAWDYDVEGTIERTAWIDHSPVGLPIAADTRGLLQQHETSPDADGTPLSWSFGTGYTDLPPGGETFTFFDFIVPDFLGNWSQIQVVILAVDSPFDTPRTYGPFIVTSTTPYINVRVRGRQIALDISGNDAGSFVRLGAVRYRFAPAGRR